MKTKRGRPRKEPAERKEMLAFRADDAERTEFEQAADAADLRLSDWIRDRLKAAAKRELRRASRSD
jgi:hypothetical protein